MNEGIRGVDSIAEDGFGTSKYGITPETKNQVNEKLVELWLNKATEWEIDYTDSAHASLEENNDITRIIEEIAKNRASKLREIYEGLGYKSYISHTDYANRFGVSEDVMNEAVKSIFESKFGLDDTKFEWIKPAEMVRLLKSYFEE